MFVSSSLQFLSLGQEQRIYPRHELHTRLSLLANNELDLRRGRCARAEEEEYLIDACVSSTNGQWLP